MKLHKFFFLSGFGFSKTFLSFNLELPCVQDPLFLMRSLLENIGALSAP